MALHNLKLSDRNCIVSELYHAHLNEDKLFTVWHFVNNYGLAKTTVFRTNQRADKIWRGQRKTLEQRLGSGRPRALTRRQERSVLRAWENKKGPSTKSQARKYNVTHNSVCLASSRSKGPKEAEGAGNQRGKDAEGEGLRQHPFLRFLSSGRQHGDRHRWWIILYVKGDEVRGNGQRKFPNWKGE